MAKIKIVWTHFAKQQRDEIFKYWNRRNRSFSYSQKLKNTIKEKTDQLKTHPYSGKKVTNEDTRILTLKNYSLIYFIQKNIIFIIISFWENHENPENFKIF